MLKFFALTTRGLAKREQSKLTAFVRETSLVENYSNEQLGAWLKQIWCADIYEYHRGNITKYQALLDAIPYSLIPTLRVHAAMLAGGSGRKPIKSFWAARIESEFNSNPQALIPPPNIETNDYPHRTA